MYKPVNRAYKDKLFYEFFYTLKHNETLMPSQPIEIYKYCNLGMIIALVTKQQSFVT